MEGRREIGTVKCEREKGTRIVEVKENSFFTKSWQQFPLGCFIALVSTPNFAYYLHFPCLAHFYPEGGGCGFLWNVCTYLPLGVVSSHKTVILMHCVRLVSLLSINFVRRLRSRCRGSTVARRMRCTPRRRALRTKSVMSVAGKTCLCRSASALNLQPMGYLALCSSHRVTLMRGWHSAVLACKPCWVGVVVQDVAAHPLS